MTWRLGVDIGGTFTDFALFDEGGGRIAVYKRLTTPADPSAAVVEGAAALLARENVPMAGVDAIAHGTPSSPTRSSSGAERRPGCW